MMNSIFSGDFSDAGGLAGWTVEQHVPDGYPDFAVRSGALVFLDAGNRLLPHVSSLRNFILRGEFDVHWQAAENHFSFTLHFDYDPSRRKGKSLEIASDGKRLFLYLKSAEGKRRTFRVPGSVWAEILKDRNVRFVFERKGAGLCLTLNGEKYLRVSVGGGEGKIALERGHFIGDLNLKSLEIASDDIESVKLREDVVPFTRCNGMPDPILWTVAVFRLGECFRIDVTLSGGIMERERIPWFPYHGTYSENLTAPYLRIVSPAREMLSLPLTEKNLLLKNPLDKYFYMEGIGYEKPPWPLRRSFYANAFDPDRSLLFCGYEYYCSPVTGKAFAGGPSETVYSCAERKILYRGESLSSGNIRIELGSQEEKRILHAIPPEHPLREKAVVFAKKNHFFLEGEPCRFHFDLHALKQFPDGELRVEYTLLNAFLEELAEPRTLSVREDENSPRPEIRHYISREFELKDLRPGVYHLAFRLRQGNHLLGEKRRAFEVMSESASGPRASNLPHLYSAPTEVMGVDSNEFDPFLEECSDIAHYIDTAAGVMPHFAEAQRVWELYKLYHRDWFLWLTMRTAENPDFELHRESVGRCDFIAILSEWQKKCLVRLCCRAFYTGPQLDVLYEYARERKFHPREIGTFVQKRTYPSRKIFNELVEKRFYDWMDFFNARFHEDLRVSAGALEKVNPRAKLANYGPLAVYPAAYKTAHSCQYVFSYLPRPGTGASVYDGGFFNYADLPYICRYSINRGPFMAASVRLEYGKVKLYPEIYTPNNGGICPDAAVARAWPSLGMWGGKDFPFPVSLTLKRVLEYVYGSIRHDGKDFHYWTDFGFHSRTWERARYEALLKLWGFIAKHPAKRPLKACAFLCSEECCRNHKVCYDEYGEKDCYTPFGDLFNTAEEAPAYAYEMSRIAGMNGGFAVNRKSLAGLSGNDLDVLVLPPLSGVTEKDLREIRRLHKEGVSLLGFEEVAGLEDLFGVKAGRAVRVRRIQVSPGAHPLAELSSLTEYTDHRAAAGQYRAKEAAVLLEGEIPVLFTHTTRWGKTALFNIPPTVVRREDQFNRVGNGRDSISPLLNRATQEILRFLSAGIAGTDAGKLLAFEDMSGHVHLIVEEDAHPLPAKKIAPLVTVRLPGLKRSDFVCEKEFSIVELTPGYVKLRFFLNEDEFVLFSIIRQGKGES